MHRLVHLSHVKKQSVKDLLQAAGAEEGASSLAPQVSVVLSSTSWADRDTAGFRALSPGSSMAVSSYGLMRSSISPEPAKRAGEAQMDAAIVKRKYFIVKTPF